MNDESTHYIAIPHTSHRAERIDALLKKRMKQFALTRRRKLWQEKAI